jgi:hypothetical protein
MKKCKWQVLKPSWWLYDEIHLTEEGLADFRILVHERADGSLWQLNEYQIQAGEVTFERLSMENVM